MGSFIESSCESDGKLNILYSVGETIKSEYNTGIQRVVRLLGRYLDGKCNPYFIKFDFEGNQFSDLTDEEISYIGKFSGIKVKSNKLNLPLEGKWFIMPELIIRQESTSTKRMFERAKQHKMKILSIFYDDIPYKLNTLYSEEIKDMFMIHVNSLLSMSDLILTISHYSYDRLLTHCDKYQNRDQLISKIIPCSLPQEFPGSQREFIYDFPQTGTYKILCVSTIEPRKNQLPLIEAVNSLKSKYNIELTLVGMIVDRCRDYYNTIINLSSSNENIKHFTIISDEQLSDLYRSSNLTVYPSIEEGYGLPILESIWNCKPCICMNYGSMAEVAVAGCIKVDCNSSDHIAKAIDAFLSDSTLRDKLVDEIKSVRLRTWDQYAEDFISNINSFNKKIDIINYLHENVKI
jgi:glycosyltransferase involved in cell wall biosynthesis